MPATSVHKSDLLDLFLCVKTGLYHVNTICLVDSAGNIRDCGTASYASRSDVVGGSRAVFTASITITASYTAVAVSVRHRVGATDLELFRTPLATSIDTTGVSRVDVTWYVDHVVSFSHTGVYESSYGVELMRRVSNSLGGLSVSACLTSIIHMTCDEPPPTEPCTVRRAVVTLLTKDRPGARAYHGAVGFTVSGYLSGYAICANDVTGGGTCDTLISGGRSWVSEKALYVTTNDAISFTISFSV
jgi:hypothetical protein